MGATDVEMPAECVPEWVTHRKAAQAALKGLPFAAVPIEQLADIYERMLRLCDMGKATIDAWNKMPKEMANLRHAIFAQADFGSLFAGNWLPHDVRKEVYDRVNDDLRKCSAR